LHAFNGWADKFLATPARGLDDVYISANGKAGKFAWVAAYHGYRANDFARNTRKVWMQVEYKGK
jgi:hypothetical protein